jgi:multicomponent Na+:H+ antiporter subunit D
MTLSSLALLVPLLGATLLAGTTSLDRRRFADAVALAAAVGVTAACAGLLVQASDHTVVAWMGGWRPRHGVALGIALAVDPLGAGMATFAAALTVAALVVGLRLPSTSGHLVHALVLVFLAGMVGLCLSGDVFTSFVFFELMSIASLALAGLLVDRRSPVEGALNFAVTTTAGSAALLVGIALLYGRTGALNMAQVGAALHGSDVTVAVAFALIATGFLTKAAIVPFHFWLADTYTAAPTAAVVLFAGAMSELGLFGLARLYWAVFEGPLGPHAGVVRAVLVALGALTALVGALMCWPQRLLKRMLAFATISHLGIGLCGVALLSPGGVAGAARYLVGDGLVKAGLFVLAGLLANRYGTGDIGRLHGRARELRWLGGAWLLGGLALAGTPPAGPFAGRALIEDGAMTDGLWWLPWTLLVAGALTGGAVLRAGRLVFLGAGRPHEGEPAERAGEAPDPGREGAPYWATAAVLIALGLAWGLVPGLGDAAGTAAHRFTDRAAYVAAVLGGPPAPGAAERGAPPTGAERGALPPTAAERAAQRPPTAAAYAFGIACGLLSLALAAVGVLRARAPREPAWAHRLRALHSGRPTDYLAWLVAGAAALAAVCAIGLG